MAGLWGLAFGRNGMRFARLAGGCALVYFLSSGERRAKSRDTNR
jgi:hypothetical protein